MTEKSPDDVFALFSRFDLDGESYRVFPKKEPVLRSLDNPQPIASETIAPEKERAANSEHSLRVATPVDFEREDESSTAIQTSRSALRSLCRHVDLAENRVKARSFSDLLNLSIFVYGTAGGVGATTISATLARLLSINGRSCGIVDDQGESALPFFFGQQRAAYDHRQYAGLHAAAELSVRIISRKANELDSTETENFGQHFWFEKEASLMQKYLDHLIVDVRRGHKPIVAPNTTSGALFVAIPDVSSLVGARALKRILNEKSPASKQICVLNKFDPSVALHAEIRDWFTENFSTTLILGRSDLVSEAHAEGLTVVDWAPQSPVAADFSRLLAVIQNEMFVPFTSKTGELSSCS